MNLLRHRGVNFLAALIVPLIVQAAFVVLSRQMPSFTWRGDYVALMVSAIAGFAFIIRQYRWWSVVVGLAYFPAVLVILIYFTFFLIGAIYGDSL
jgi:hypothetical protein